VRRYPSRPRSCAIVILAVWLGVAAALPGRLPAQAASAAAQMGAAGVEYNFGEGSIVFSARLQSDTPVDKAIIFIHPDGSPNTVTRPAQVKALSAGQYEISYPLDQAEGMLRPFSQPTYYYEVSFKGDNRFRSDTFTFDYSDNRFRWKTRLEAPIRIHWYSRDETFGQNVLDTALKGLERVKEFIPVDSPENVDYYIYNSTTDLDAVLNTFEGGRVVGHADPDLGVVTVVIPTGPDAELLSEQRIPHELMHILLYRNNPDGYARIPTWLNEGLASAAELYPNPDYRILLESALKKGALLSMAGLCPPFPRDISSAQLAYAQAASFTRYLYSTFGRTKMNELLGKYIDGLGCERAIEATFGVSLRSIELQWRQETLGENASLTGLGNLLPYALLMLGLVLIPISIGALPILRRRRLTASLSHRDHP
jgi:hypothetical protein